MCAGCQPRQDSEDSLAQSRPSRRPRVASRCDRVTTKRSAGRRQRTEETRAHNLAARPSQLFGWQPQWALAEVSQRED